MIRAPFNCEEIGKWLAHCDDHQQAALLNAMAEELRISCGDKLDTQLCYLSEHLTERGGALVEALAAYVTLRNEGGTE